MTIIYFASLAIVWIIVGLVVILESREHGLSVGNLVWIAALLGWGIIPVANTFAALIMIFLLVANLSLWFTVKYSRQIRAISKRKIIKPKTFG